MNVTTRFAALAAGCLFAGSIALNPQQDPGDLGKKVADSIRASMEDPAAMQKWMETTKTGTAHEFLSKAFVGQWNTEVKMWMDPAAEPMTTKGSATIEPILGGRFIRERFKGEMMGQPFEGESTTGFDNNKKQFVASWLDSMSTGMISLKGSISPDGKTITLIGEMDEPMSGEMGKAIKMVTVIESADKHRGEMYEILYGKEFKVMEIAYTRAGPGSRN